MEKTIQTFEKYLEGVCFEANPRVLDDDIPDFFDDWLGSQDGEDYIRLGDEYGKALVATAKEEERESILKAYQEATGIEDDIFIRSLK